MNNYELYLVNADSVLSKGFFFSFHVGLPQKLDERKDVGRNKRPQPAARLVQNSTRSVVLERKKLPLLSWIQFFHSLSEQGFLAEFLHTEQLNKYEKVCIQLHHTPSSSVLCR